MLMHLMVYHAAEDGVVYLVPFMLAFFALRKMSHALESPGRIVVRSGLRQS